MSDHAVRTVLSGMSYTECPRWHQGRLWFVDFYLHQVYSVAEDGSDLRVEADVPAQPSGLGWLPGGDLLVVSMKDAKILRRTADGSLVEHADLARHVAGLPNDMVVDGQGRAYVGNFGFDLMSGDDIETAPLLRVDPDGSVTKVADDLWFPNGSVITDDGLLLVDETFGNRVSAFDIAADGSLGPRRDWAKFGELPTARDLATAVPQGVVAPDGCGLDAEGCLWIADASHGRVVRVREGGEILDEVRPGTGVFACMLGGSDGTTLFMSCAPDFDEHARSVARGAQIKAVTVSVPRAGRP
ncbi:SMP-30/gluconolactonase/LRE family protein [Allobranchiibius sp. GilTou73]|uniref:SMP-30/gluconolactonase/LRE family protein n=1 Tax=Allobranchiibius sp. GilTou73 TaxID=2904523 RepID=UPI001F3620D9|nr:SMP-30/gluconolactonase/LRE family protein [Allobranchiibius sp. GilTou73]UIJ34458.1 SMP-30/gluconolactonase/LRE family protein [Allobranchiibius sp. GilTou73]